jgi:hypothetical protein
MKLKRWGILAAITAAFAAGAKAGVEYAKTIYVSKDRKFIKGEVVDKDEAKNGEA